MKFLTMVCWASGLGGCSEKSREHIFSKSLFLTDDIMVQGFDWCKTTPRKVGIKNLVSKILCRKHNSDLSPVDDAGAEAFDAFRRATQLSNSRSSVRTTYWHIKRFHIHGPMLERWFLKTLINVCFGGAYPVGKSAPSAGNVSQELVQLAFGHKPFPGRSGLYQAAHQGLQLRLDERVSASPLVRKGEGIVGGMFYFRGFRFLLFLDPEGISQLPQGVGVLGEDWSPCQLMLHPREIRTELFGSLSHVTHFKW